MLKVFTPYPPEESPQTGLESLNPIPAVLGYEVSIGSEDMIGHDWPAILRTRTVKLSSHRLRRARKDRVPVTPA